MSLRCLANIHEAGPQCVWNAGYYVTSCSRCRADLIRPMHGKWKPVPKGHRIVWKPKPAGHPDWNSVARRAPGVAARQEAVPPQAAEPAANREVRMRLVPSGGDRASVEPPQPSFREWQRRSAAR
jgi:hypothetical protein